MKLIQNHGNDRVIDELNDCLADNSRLDLASSTFSLIAFGEMRKQLDRLKDCRIVLPGYSGADLSLLGTEGISEGQNLQDCDCLINYDIHWNPVRIIQRFGRIDRIGSPNTCIQLVNFWPNIELEEYINLEQRVSGRMVLLDISATGEENLIEQQSGNQMNDLEYRRKQLLKLQDAVIDLEDLSSGVSIADLKLIYIDPPYNTGKDFVYPDNDSVGPWTSSDLTRREYREHDFYEIELPSGRKVTPAAGRSWSVPPTKFKELVADKRVWFGPNGDAMPRFKRFLTDVANRVVPVTWLPSELSGDNQGGKRQIKGLFPEVMDVFENPKPTELITTLIRMTTVPGDLVLDFFTGTGTTGHAVMAQNRSSLDRFRFILVQLPEPTEKPTMATIAELTKERLRRAGKKIREENPLFPSDIGFRVFKLASSNIRAWEPDRDKLAETLLDSVEHLKTDRTVQDILFELLLKLDLDLCVPIETRTIHPQISPIIADKIKNKSGAHLRESASSADNHAFQIHSIGGGSLLVCLSTAIPPADVEPLALGLVAWHKELKPAGETTVVFRDSAFADDVAKTNLTAILQQHGLENVRSL